MTVSQALMEGLEVAAVGLCIVFSVLIILMIVLVLMKKIFYREEKTAKKETKAAAVPTETQKKAEPSMDEGELIAVLTAAVAASLNTSTYHLNIKSFRRVDQTAPNWNKAGLQDVIQSRF